MAPFRYPALATLLFLLLPCLPAPAVSPNIIIFLADDMGMGDTSVYHDWSGNKDDRQLNTPNMARIANMGIRFMDAHSPHSRCSTSRYALLTGRYCWRTSLKHWVLFGVQCDPLIEKSRPTIASFLRQSGYRTGMVGKWHLGLSYRRTDGSPAEGWNDADLTKPLADGPTDHGFDFFYGISRSHPTSGPSRKSPNTPGQRQGPGWIHNRRIIGATGKGKQLDDSYVLDEIGPVLHARASEFLRSATAASKPFFLYFASPANHTPYTPCKSIAGRKVAGESRNVDGSLTGNVRLDFIHENDVQVGLLLDYLQRTNDPRRPGHRLLDNTLFIFASDNGAENRSKTATGPLRSNKGSTYEGGHRIPFFASWPAGAIGDGRPRTPGKTSNRLLALNDLFATFAEILGKPLPDLSKGEIGAEDSISQLGALRGQEHPPRPPVFPNDHREASKKTSQERAVVAVRSNASPLKGQWKLFLDHRFATEGALHPFALYNLATDQFEMQNLLNDSASTAALEFLLEEARKAGGDNGSTRP